MAKASSSSYLLQVSEFAGYYNNPYKSGGKGIKYTKWATIVMLGEGRSRQYLMDVWKERYDQRDKGKLTRFRITYKGKTIIQPNGRVYEQRIDVERGEWMQYVETVPGLEDVV